MRKTPTHLVNGTVSPNMKTAKIIPKIKLRLDRGYAWLNSSFFNAYVQSNSDDRKNDIIPKIIKPLSTVICFKNDQLHSKSCL